MFHDILRESRDWAFLLPKTLGKKCFGVILWVIGVRCPKKRVASDKTVGNEYMEVTLKSFC